MFSRQRQRRAHEARCFHRLEGSKFICSDLLNVAGSSSRIQRVQVRVIKFEKKQSLLTAILLACECGLQPFSHMNGVIKVS